MELFQQVGSQAASWAQFTEDLDDAHCSTRGDVSGCRRQKTSAQLEIQTWALDRLVLYARNPRTNEAVVDRTSSNIRELGFKIPLLARSDGEVVDGHLRIKAPRKLRIDQIPVIP